MRLIDADALIKKMPTVMDMQDAYMPIHFKEWLIDDAPTIDAVEVVRCKDCKHREKYPCDEIEFYECSHLRLYGTKVGVEDDWFCADGERRTDE